MIIDFTSLLSMKLGKMFINIANSNLAHDSHNI